jgi:uncharacterized protein (TIGR03382 family)
MRRIPLATALVLAVASGLPVLGQGTKNPPRIYSIDFALQPYIGDPSFDFSDSFDRFFFFFGFFAPLGYWGPPQPFDPATDVAHELDLVTVTLVVTDQDLSLDPNDPNSQQSQVKFYYRLDAFGSSGPPAAPPLIGTTNLLYTLYEQPPRLPDPPKSVMMVVYLWVPKFLGANQQRLRGNIDYDVLWSIDLRVADSDNPKDGEWDARQLVLKAIENNRFLPPNPPPYADAGPDQRVKVDSTARLDGSRSFDSSNLGFDPNDLNVFLKDKLEYAWEWISGPELVEIQPDSAGGGNSSPYARVTLNTVTTNDNPYVFRLTVSDGINSPPSSDVVQIYVVQELPPNHAPTAVILDPNGQALDLSVAVQATVGDTLQFKALAGPDGADPDADTLDYRWRQTNVVGGGLLPDELVTVFIPMEGMDQQVVSWKAVSAGTFYLSLTVTDLGGLSSNARLAINVAESTSGSGTSSTQSPRTRDLRALLDPNASADQSAAAAGCGAGSLLPLALLPGLLGLLRRRYSR